jgi:hypothetical protein
MIKNNHNHYFTTDDHFKDAFEFNRKQMEAPEVQSTTVESFQSKTSSFESFMTAKRHCAENNSTTTQDEEFVRYCFICLFYCRYFNAPISDYKCNPLEYWKANVFNFPILSAMAKDYLTVQASSVPSERPFSSGTDLVTSVRCSSAGKTIEKTQFLKYNI